MISCGARLAPFDIQEVRDITAYDELDLGSIGLRKTALFVIISDTDDSLNFLVSIMYTQLFNLLCTIADDKNHGKLPVHVRCILDEFANVGQIPKFDKLIATIRSREISASIILQSKAQLKAIYKDNAETIEGNCDTFLFLGGKCILQVRGVRPFFSDKVDITKHEMYPELSDYNKKNEFDIAAYVRNYGKVLFNRKDNFMDLDLEGVHYPEDLMQYAIKEAGIIVEGAKIL